MSLLERVKPGISRRVDFSLRRNKCALVIIDVQKYLSYPEQDYFHKMALPRAMKNIEKIAHQFRAVRDVPNATGCEVIFTYVQSSTKDGRDVSLDYKLSGPMLANIPRIGDTDIFVTDCTPDPHTGKGDILLPKTSCSVFQSTNLDYLLRNLGIEQIVVCGQLTDECVESAVRDGADLGYLMTVPEDACAAISPERHKIGLQGMQGFCRILKTAHITWEIAESVDAYNRSETISLEVLTTFLKGRGFTDAAIEVASAFAGNNGHKKTSSSSLTSSPKLSSTTTAPLTEDPTNDAGSNEDVVTVSSAVLDNIVRQQKTAAICSTDRSSVHVSPIATNSPNTVNQHEATPPTKNGGVALPRYKAKGMNSTIDQRGRDPSELITPDLDHNNNNNNPTSMTSSQYHQLQTMNNSMKIPVTASGAAKTEPSLDNSTQTFIALQRRMSGPVDLDDDSEHLSTNNNNHKNRKNKDPPAPVAVDATTNELLEL